MLDKRSGVALGRWALALACLMVAGCGSVRLDSRWLDRAIIVDGDDGDWQNAKLYVKDWPIDVGVLNDGEYLYLCMTTVDRDLQTEVLMRGLELWIDPGGGRKKEVGIRFPQGAAQRGLEGEEPGEFGRGRGGMRGSRGGGRNMRRPPGGARQFDPERFTAAMKRLGVSGEMVLLESEDDEGLRKLISRDDPLQIRVAYDRGRLVYEARIPLHNTEPPLSALQVNAGDRVGVGFKSAEMDMSRMMAQRGGRKGGGLPGGDGMPGVGMPAGGMPGGGMGGMRGGRGGGMGAMEASFEKWGAVQLATGEER